MRSIKWERFEEVQAAVDDWMDYYNNERYQIGLKKMSPNEYYTYITTGKHPVSIQNVEEPLK